MKRASLPFFLVLMAFVVFSTPAQAWTGKAGWVFKAEAPFTSSVAAAGGLVFAGDSVGNFYAIHASSGQLAWSYKGTNSVVGLPCIEGNKLVFNQADGTVTALNLQNGSVIWRYLPPEESYAAETVVDGSTLGDGKVFFVKGDGKLYAISAANGKELWTYNSGLELRTAPLFAEGVVLLGEQKGIFSAINPKSGKRAWGGGAGGAINTPSAENGYTYFSSWDGTVQSVRVKGVVPQWKANVGAPLSTPPVIDGDRLFVGTGNGTIVALSKKDGSVLWNFDTQGGSVLAHPVVAGGFVFVGGGQGTLFVLDAATGAARFTFPTGSGINGTPAFMNGVLYVGSSDGNLYSIF